MPDDFIHCEELVRAGDKDRFLATLFAPAKYRRALFALYAFNLEIARVRELAREPLPGELRLQWWREAITGGTLENVGAHPVAAALREVIVRYRLPPQAFADLIEARRFDLYDEPMADFAALERYTESTSSALLALAMRILNDGRETGAADLARHAGIAYAIAGLLRALPLHAARRQLYVPLEVLQRHGARLEDIFAGKASVGLRAALVEMRLCVRAHLAAARPLLAAAPSAAAPALLPVALARPVLARMERRGYHPFQFSDLPQWRRQWILWRAARRGLVRAL